MRKLGAPYYVRINKGISLEPIACLIDIVHERIQTGGA